MDEDNNGYIRKGYYLVIATGIGVALVAIAIRKVLEVVL